MSDLSGTGRHLSPVELRLWTSFLDAGRMIEQALAADLVANQGMSHREYEVLVRLDGASGRMRMSELARQIAASGPLVTQTVERLEKRGWVTRERSSSDNRGIDATLTADGQAALASASEPHAELVRKLLLDRVGTDRRDVVAAALGEVADHLRLHRGSDACAIESCPLGPDGLPR